MSVFGSTKPSASEDNTAVKSELREMVESYEDRMVESISNGEAFGIDGDIEKQNTCNLAATAYGMAALVTRARLRETK